MAILWAGGEDIDFPLIGAFGVNTGGTTYRTGWARCSLRSIAATTAISTPFLGGLITSAWFSARIDLNSSIQANLYCGVYTSATGSFLGVGTDPLSGNRTALVKYDGVTQTVLASETGLSMPSGAVTRIDMQIVNYGATATVNVYIGGSSVISFTGNVVVSGATGFDSVFIRGLSGNTADFSEVFVSDTDSRAVQGLQTLALTGAGTTNAWTNNTFSNINGTSFTDSTPTFVNVAGSDQQYTVTAPTPAIYTVAAVSITARMAKSAAAVPTKVKLGYGNGASGSFGTGAAKTLTTSFQSYQQIDAINPVTGTAFTPSDLTSLQLDLESA